VKSILFTVLLSLVLTLYPTKKADAALWPAIDPIIKQGLENVQNHIDGVILTMLKQQAAKMLNGQVGKLMGGKGNTGANAMFITNWQDYMVTQPQNVTKTYMNDYLSKITGGKGSVSGYQANPNSQGIGGLLGSSGSSGTTSGAGTLAGLLGSGGSTGGNYASQLVAAAKTATVSQPQPKMTFTGNPSQMFASGNFKNLDSFLSGINNPWAFQMNAQTVYQQQLQQNQQIAKTKAVAYQGFKGTGEKANGTGNISSPGSLNKSSVASVQNIGNSIIANATHPEEVITAFISQMITKAITTGLGQVQSMINQQTNKLTQQATTQINQAIKASGPAAIYQFPGQTVTVTK